MVSVRAVLDMPALRLTVRAGADLLGRRISRIYGTELPDPGRFLAGGELVVTGLLWLRADADVGPFVAALADRGAAVLVACDADTGVIPVSLVDECVRRGVPLLEAAVDLSFADIIDHVGQALADERTAGSPHRGLLAAVARGAELPELLASASAQLAAPCWVLAPLGRVVAAAGPALTDDRIAALVREFLLADGRPRQVRGRQPVTVLPVPDRTGSDVTRWFLVVGGTTGVRRDETMAELAGVVGVHRQRAQESRRVAEEVTGTVLRAVSTGVARPAEIVSTALAAGVDVAAPLRVLAAATPDGPDGRAVAVLAELVATVQVPARPGLVGVVDEQVYALLPADEESDVDLADRAATALGLLAPALAGGRVVVGLSSVTSGPADLRAAVQEARHARELGERQPGATRVVAGRDVAVHQLLLAGVPAELRRALRRRVLGPVFDHDAAHGGNLVETLRVFLDSSGSWSRAAARLHVHVNTLRYRIGRMEELTGVDLGDFTQRVDVYLALHAED
jgi:sugar diacid utilization regulator